MKTKINTQSIQFSTETRKELEINWREAEKQCKHHSQEAERYRELVRHYNAILGTSKNGPHKGEKTDGSQNESALSPTDFVLELLNKSPNRWISIQEFLFMSRSAFESGEVLNRSGKIENSIHSVLTRFRNNHLVFTKGHRESRKYKMKT